jgi:hypothetical protein
MFAAFSDRAALHAIISASEGQYVNFEAFACILPLNRATG